MTLLKKNQIVGTLLTAYNTIFSLSFSCLGVRQTTNKQTTNQAHCQTKMTATSKYNDYKNDKMLILCKTPQTDSLTPKEAVSQPGKQAIWQAGR